MTEIIPHVLAELSTYLDGGLSGADKRRVAAHIASCDSCKRHEHDLRALRDLIHETPSMIPSPSLLESAGRPLLIAAVVIGAVLAYWGMTKMHRPVVLQAAAPVAPHPKLASVIPKPEPVKTPPPAKPAEPSAPQASDSSIPALQELANTTPQPSSATTPSDTWAASAHPGASTDTPHP